MRQEVEGHESVAIRRQGPCIRRVELPSFRPYLHCSSGIISVIFPTALPGLLHTHETRPSSAALAGRPWRNSAATSYFLTLTDSQSRYRMRSHTASPVLELNKHKLHVSQSVSPFSPRLGECRLTPVDLDNWYPRIRQRHDVEVRLFTYQLRKNFNQLRCARLRIRGVARQTAEVHICQFRVESLVSTPHTKLAAKP